MTTGYILRHAKPYSVVLGRLSEIKAPNTKTIKNSKTAIFSLLSLLRIDSDNASILPIGRLPRRYAVHLL